MFIRWRQGSAQIIQSKRIEGKATQKQIATISGWQGPASFWAEIEDKLSGQDIPAKIYQELEARVPRPSAEKIHDYRATHQTKARKAITWKEHRGFGGHIWGYVYFAGTERKITKFSDLEKSCIVNSKNWKEFWYAAHCATNGNPERDQILAELAEKVPAPSIDQLESLTTELRQKEIEYLQGKLEDSKALQRRIEAKLENLCSVEVSLLETAKL